MYTPITCQPADLESCFRILRKRPARRALDFPSFADLREILAEPCQADAQAGLKTGFTGPVATHPDHQRRGLARALRLAQMAALKERGMDTARLATGNENLAMQAAARSAGYRQVGRGLRYAWTIQRNSDT